MEARKIELRKKIKYEKKKMQYCAYSHEDLMYLRGLETELAEIEAKETQII
jgi:hypothetical protein